MPAYALYLRKYIWKIPSIQANMELNNYNRTKKEFNIFTLINFICSIY